MWLSEQRDWPATGTQVVGIDRDGDLGWWTRDGTGWYVSEKVGQIGHSDARGPVWWQHPPRAAAPMAALKLNS